MRSTRFVVVCVLMSLASAVGAQNRRMSVDDWPMPGRVPSSRPVAFVDVTVLPMTFNGVLEHQTVVTMHGRIQAIGPVDEIEIPAGAISIDGT
ncbi:MAG: hypothetical protein IFK93_14750, partial [Acidobacteria bacterium]|nr:hypothetical protein [Candidatus Sulfomarinibacter kjeldsenii]